jgi:MFS family permease
MSNINRFKLAWLISKSAFWIPLIIPFFNSKGFQADQVFLLLAVYSFFIVILEYPTGVIGDYFSHKLSISLGFLISGIALFLSVFTLPTIVYYFLLFLLALGISLISGSDEALLYKLSKDFKKDWASLNSVVMVYALITIVLGGFLGSINLNIPVLLDASLYLISFLLMFTVIEPNKGVQKNIHTNIFAFAIGGLKYLLSNKKLIGLFGINIPLSVFLLSMKWIYNPMFEGYKLPQYYWGIGIGIFSLITIVSSLIYRKSKKINVPILGCLFLASLLFIAPSNYLYISVLSFGLMHFLLKFLDMYFVVEVNKQLNDTMRASLVSLKSLLIRLLSAGYMLFISFVLAKFSINYLFIFTGLIIILFWVVFAPFVYINKRHK